MTKDDGTMDAESQLRAALREEAGELWPPPSLWPRVQAALAQPIAPSPGRSTHAPNCARCCDAMTRAA